MRQLWAGLLLVALAATATASPSADIGASASCTPTLPADGSTCSVSQAGQLRVVCAAQCDLLATGVSRANDNMPLMRLGTTLRLDAVGSASNSCVGAGLGATECAFELRFPLFLSAGTCRDGSVTTQYARTPAPTESVARHYSVCRGTGTEHTLTPK